METDSSVSQQAECQESNIPPDFWYTKDTVLPSVGDFVEVLWPLDNQFYSGHVSRIYDYNEYTIRYDDGDAEQISDMNKETWHFSTSAVLRALTTSASSQSTEVISMTFLTSSVMEHF